MLKEWCKQFVLDSYATSLQTSISVQVRVMALNESMQPITERVVIDIRVCTVFCAFIFNQQRCRFMCSKTTAICLMSNAAVVFSNCGYYIYQIIKWNIETTVCQRSPYLHAHQLSQMTLLLICFIKARLLHHFHTCIVKLVYNPSYLHFLYLDGRSIVLKCSNFFYFKRLRPHLCECLF